MDNDKLRKHLLQITNIEENVLDKVLEEIENYYTQNEKDYIISRHHQLKKRTDKKNDEIYEIIRKELEVGLFRAKSYSIRQIRRIIYG